MSLQESTTHPKVSSVKTVLPNSRLCLVSITDLFIIQVSRSLMEDCRYYNISTEQTTDFDRLLLHHLIQGLSTIVLEHTGPERVVGIFNESQEIFISEYISSTEEVAITSSLIRNVAYLEKIIPLTVFRCTWSMEYIEHLYESDLSQYTSIVATIKNLPLPRLTHKKTLAALKKHKLNSLCRRFSTDPQTKLLFK